VRRLLPSRPDAACAAHDRPRSPAIARYRCRPAVACRPCPGRHRFAYRGATRLRVRWLLHRTDIDPSPVAAVTMLWIKSLHIIFMVTWFAGLFYLPRLFVYHAMAAPEDRVGIERFKLMERKLYFGIMTPGAVLTIAFGV